jgi:hypothetical protein
MLHNFLTKVKISPSRPSKQLSIHKKEKGSEASFHSFQTGRLLGIIMMRQRILHWQKRSNECPIMDGSGHKDSAKENKKSVNIMPDTKIRATKYKIRTKTKMLFTEKGTAINS